MPTEEAVTVVLVTAFLSSAAWLTIKTFLNHRLEMARIKKGQPRNAAIERENLELKETVSLMQDRIAVLEQIAIDPARITAEEIERLR
ncbi:MAG: hypothetical protein ACX930_08460 [Erythrobacter sp.]